MRKFFALFYLVPVLAFGQTIDYQPFANGAFANVETQAAYLADLANPVALQNGFQTGIAKSNQVNKVLRQQSMISAAVANAISQANGQSVLDDGNLTNLIGYVIRMVQNANSIWLSSVAGTNTITAAVAPLAIAPASYVAGGRWLLLVGTTNTGAATLNITGNVGGIATPLGARNVFKQSSSGPLAVAAGDLVAGNVYQLVDDGTRFVIVGARPYAQFTAIASAATLNLDAVSGDYGHVTGSTTITAVTLAQGERRTVVFDGAPLLTSNASIILPTGASIQLAAGDAATFRGEGAGVVRVTQFQRANGLALLASDLQIITATGTWTKPTWARWVQATCIGAGGGGGGGQGGGSGTNREAGTGGGGGSVTTYGFPASILGATETVTVGASGAAGAGGISTTGGNGVAGGSSSFGARLIAYGGGGGTNGGQSVICTGGSGAGTGGAGVVGTCSSTSTSNLGGVPASVSGAAGIAGQGAGSVNLADPPGAEWGGGAGGGGGGGGSQFKGGGSLFAGGGGAVGEICNSGNFALGATAGGASGTYSPGTGSAGASGGGATGSSSVAANGIGNGGGSGGCNLSGTGGTGGAGGAPGGGGAGGGGGTTTGGNGGVGGRGECRIFSLF